MAALDLARLEGGQGRPLLLLLHGLGGNAALWDGVLPLIARDWPGRWLAPDLRGHGLSPRGDSYGLADHVADVAALIADEADVQVIGHSMGGAIAIALGGTARPDLRVVAFGVKEHWPAPMLDRFAQLAAAPPRRFDSAAEAADRFVLASGLKGVIGPHHRAAHRGVIQHGEAWQLAADPATHAIAGVSIAVEAQAMTGRLTMLRAENDPVVTPEEAAAIGVPHQPLPGLSHNPHVEDPARCWQAIVPMLAR